MHNQESRRNRLLTEKEAAELLRISPKTLQRWRHLRTGPEVTKLGRAVRYHLGILEDFTGVQLGD